MQSLVEWQQLDFKIINTPRQLNFEVRSSNKTSRDEIFQQCLFFGAKRSEIGLTKTALAAKFAKKNIECFLFHMTEGSFKNMQNYHVKFLCFSGKNSVYFVQKMPVFRATLSTFVQFELFLQILLKN
jgi:hypothetical protein